jgi:hypothetical protein
MRREMEHIKTTHHNSTKLSPPTSPPSFNNHFQTKSVKQEDISPIPTFMSTQAQGEEYCQTVNEQNENQNVPIPADTLVCYSYGITTVYGHIMDERPPTYKNGIWQYDIFTNNGTRLWNCKGTYIKVLHSKMAPNLNADQSNTTNTADDDSVQRRPTTYVSPFKRNQRHHINDRQ